MGLQKNNGKHGAASESSVDVNACSNSGAGGSHCHRKHRLRHLRVGGRRPCHSIRLTSCGFSRCAFATPADILPEATQITLKYEKLVHIQALLDKQGELEEDLRPEAPKKSFTHTFRKAKKQEKVHQMPSSGVNTRDVGAVAGVQLKPCNLFRSSQLLSREEMKQYGIKVLLVKTVVE